MARMLPGIPKYWKCPLSFDASLLYCHSIGLCRLLRHHVPTATMVFLTFFLAVLRLITQYPFSDFAQ